MRAKEFITETKRGKPLDAVASVNVGTSFTTDGFQDLYRASAIMARMPDNADDIDPYSFVTNRPMIVAYTPEEVEMIKAAFQRMGVDYHEQLNTGSEEPDAVNNVSPTQGFKGY